MKGTCILYTLRLNHFLPGSIYASSSRMISVDGQRVPTAWNSSISYYNDKTMPYLVQKLSARDLEINFDIGKDVMQYQLSAHIEKGE